MSSTHTAPRTARRRTRPASSGTAEPALAADFLGDVDDAVRDQMTTSVTVHEFLQDAGTLTLADRRLLVDQALILLEGNYVHLRLKSAMHAVAPLQRLRLLQVRLRRQTPASMDPEPVFHAEMSEIFHSLRDLHTNYLLPEPFRGKVAYLPFLIEEYFDDDGDRHYVVSHIVDGFTAPDFGRGAEITHWNGIPIDRAVDQQAARFAGSNPAARHARGLESLTIRPLVIHLPPIEEWVTVTYLGGDDDTPRTLTQEWLVVDNVPPFIGDPDEVSAAAASLGLDLDSDEAGRAKTLLFAPAVVGATQGDDSTRTDATSSVRNGDAPDSGDEPADVGEQLTTTMPGVFRARSVQTASGVFGHIRIFTFAVEDPTAFVTEFVRLTRLLPPDGLIIDVRDNGGGHIHASEFTLQTLTPRRITPEPVQFSATPLNLAICRRHRDNPTGQIDLGAWFGSLERFTETGAGYSGAFPITPHDGANAIGQQYHGPVVLITDARCYSATDIFAAGFADHQIGTILGVDDNTGAGGANVWTHGLLTALLQFPSPDPQSPFVALPNGANMRVSVRRTLRVGEATAGTPVEDLGVTPDVRHHMTRADVLHGNSDLLDRAGEILAGQPVHTVDVAGDLGTDGTLTLDIDTIGVDRVDVHVDDRPRASIDVADGSVTVTIDDATTAARARVDGLHDGGLVASRTVAIATAGPTDTGTARTGMPRFAQPIGSAAGTQPTIVYVHGAGNKPPAAELKRAWDTDLFHRDLGAGSVMAHYADILHRRPGVIGADACNESTALTALFATDTHGAAANGTRRAGVDAATATDLADHLAAAASTPQGRRFAARLGAAVDTHAADSTLELGDIDSGVLPLPRAIRRILLRRLLRRLVPDAEAYFFTSKANRMRARVRSVCKAVAGPVIVVTHSLGTVIAYDVLNEPAFAARDIRLWVTMGSPLGYSEVQDEITRPLRVPAPVRRWTNVADRRDVVALDTGLHNDFDGGMTLVDLPVDNPSPNNHAACGYLRTAAVRTVVSAALASQPAR
ncbi:hypothetical protein BH23ACT10_BH23ACT10_19040 [soil metagenome]